MDATSSVVAKRSSRDDGRAVAKKSFSTLAASLMPFCVASCFTNSSTPSERVGPGRMLLTVTLVPRVRSARPRATASCAVLVTP